MTSPPIRLAFGSVLWRLFFVIAIVNEIGWWRRLRPWVRKRGFGFRLAYLILITPKLLFQAFLISAIVTVSLDLIVRLIARPLVGRWYSPRIADDPMGSALAFRMDAHESVLDRLPARMAIGRRTFTGTLIQTDRRVAFAPDAWNVEPWSLPSGQLREVATITTPSPWAKIIRGIPDRLVFRAHDESERSFLLGDPREVLAWYSEEVRQELDEYEPSAMELF